MKVHASTHGLGLREMDANAKGIKGRAMDSSGVPRVTCPAYYLSIAHPLALCPAKVGEAFGAVGLVLGFETRNLLKV